MQIEIDERVTWQPVTQDDRDKRTKKLEAKYQEYRTELKAEKTAK